MLLAGVAVPVAYLAFLIRMVLHGVWWFTYFAYFCLFGALGGWCFAVAMSPSGLAATSIVFLVSVVSLACLAAALTLQFRKQKSRFEIIAMLGGYSYPLLIAALFLIIAWRGGR